MIASVHAHAVAANGLTLAGVLSSDAASTSRASEKLGIAPAQSLSDLIEKSDVIHICTPNVFHAAAVLEVLRAGKSVICEKPLAISVAEAETLVDAAQVAGVVAAVPYVYRFYSVVREMRRRVEAGGPERVQLVHGSYLQDWLAGDGATNWRVNPTLGGPTRAFGDIGVHWFDLIEFITGQRVASLVANTVQAFGSRAGEPVATEDAVTVMFTLEGGANGSTVISQISRGRKNRLMVSIDRDSDSLEFNQEHPNELWEGTQDGSSLFARGSAALTGALPYSFLPPGHPQGYQDAFNAFVSDVYQSVTTGELVAGLPTFTDGLRGAVLSEAVLESARQSNWVNLAA
jgi:predicted dehydrogenase